MYFKQNFLKKKDVTISANKDTVESEPSTANINENIATSAVLTTFSEITILHSWKHRTKITLIDG